MGSDASFILRLRLMKLTADVAIVRRPSKAVAVALTARTALEDRPTINIGNLTLNNRDQQGSARVMETRGRALLRVAVKRCKTIHIDHDSSTSTISHAQDE